MLDVGCMRGQQTTLSKLLHSLSAHPPKCMCVFVHVCSSLPWFILFVCKSFLSLLFYPLSWDYFDMHVSNLFFFFFLFLLFLFLCVLHRIGSMILHEFGLLITLLFQFHSLILLKMLAMFSYFFWFRFKLILICFSLFWLYFLKCYNF